jgi:dTDP-4-amino-4,6-dideoxygalactose transaminase
MTIHSLPAVLGGIPVRSQGPPTWPVPDDDVLRALQAAYHDGSWGTYHGGHVERLEQRLAEYHQVSHALTCGSGTFAVELALRALKVGPGDEVLLTAYDYPGNFLSVHAVGAKPVLVDVDAGNWNLAPERLAAAVGPRTRALIASHLHGGIVPMSEVMEFAARHDLGVIEDAAQCPGGRVQGRRAGMWGDVGILSFGGSKLLCAGRGGAILTRHADLAQRARLHLLRGNAVCPLSELQAAVLLPQLDKLDARNAHRSGSVARLREGLASEGGLRFLVNRVGDSEPGYYKVGVQFDAAHFGLSRVQLVTALQAEGIAIDEGFRALHVGRSPRRFRQAGDLKESERAHHGMLVLHHPVLLGDARDLDEVVMAVEKIRGSINRFGEHSGD